MANIEVNEALVSDVIRLTGIKKEMLQMSEEDIQFGRLISQEEMDKRNLECLERMELE